MGAVELFVLIGSLNVLLCLGSPIATGKELTSAIQTSEDRGRQVRQAGVCGCALTLYDHTNYNGRSLLIKQQNADFGNDYYHDRAESAQVEGQCRWLLYEHSNFAGQAHQIDARNYPSSTGWGENGNRISSARALPPPGTEAIVLFQHGHFTGRMLVLYASDPNLPLVDFNDQLSSFIIIGGSWTLYEHPNYRGSMSFYSSGEYMSTGPPLALATTGSAQYVKTEYEHYHNYSSR